MPANKKHLSSGWTRFSKIMAVIFGSYAATMSLHIAIAKNVPNDTPVLLTSTYTAFLGWVGLMIMIYLIRKAWISWAILLALTTISSLLILL